MNKKQYETMTMQQYQCPIHPQYIFNNPQATCLIIDCTIGVLPYIPDAITQSQTDAYIEAFKAGVSSDIGEHKK